MGSKPKLSWLFYALMAVWATVILLLLGGAILFSHALSAGDVRELVTDRGSWPQPVRELLAKAAEKHIDAEPVEVFRVREFTEDYYYWRMRSSPELVELMTDEWKLKRGTTADRDAFWERWPAEWKAGERRVGQRFLGSAQGKSDNFIVIASDSEPVVYGFYYFNF